MNSVASVIIVDQVGLGQALAGLSARHGFSEVKHVVGGREPSNVILKKQPDVVAVEVSLSKCRPAANFTVSELFPELRLKTLLSDLVNTSRMISDLLDAFATESHRTTRNDIHTVFISVRNDLIHVEKVYEENNPP